MRWMSVYAVFQGTSHSGRQFLRNRPSNRHIVPLYGRSDGLFTQGIKFETLDRHLRYPGKLLNQWRADESGLTRHW